MKASNINNRVRLALKDNGIEIGCPQLIADTNELSEVSASQFGKISQNDS